MELICVKHYTYLIEAKEAVALGQKDRKRDHPVVVWVSGTGKCCR